MGKTALMAIAAFTMIGSYYGIASQRGLFASTETVSEHQYEAIARNAAKVGYDLARQQLATNFDNLAPIYGTFEGAFYFAELRVEGSLRSVKVKAQITMPDNSEKEYFVYAKFEKILLNPVADEAPAFLQYALLSDEDLELRGSISVDTVHVEGFDSSIRNANVHTNGWLKTDGKKPKVRGFGTYKKGKDSKFSDSIFQPYSNPERENTVHRLDNGVDVPSFTADDLALAVVANGGTIDQDDAGDVTLSGTYDFAAMGATRDDPYVWRVRGNLSGTGGVELNGYVMFIVDGDIDFGGNMKQKRSDFGSENTAAFYAQNNVDIKGTADVLWGQIFANGRIDIGGTPTVVGSVTAGTQIIVHGNPEVKYYPPSPALSTPFQPAEPRLKLVSYGER